MTTNVRVNTYAYATTHVATNMLTEHYTDPRPVGRA